MTLRLWLAAAGLAAAFAAGWAANGWRLGANHAAEALARSQATVRWMEAADAERLALQTKLTASDDAAAAKLRSAQDETNRLRDCLRAGTCGLRVNVAAPRCPDLPEAAPGAGVDSAAGARLDPDAESAYFALRDGIDRVQAKLTACQGRLGEAFRPLAPSR